MKYINSILLCLIVCTTLQAVDTEQGPSCSEKKEPVALSPFPSLKELAIQSIVQKVLHSDDQKWLNLIPQLSHLTQDAYTLLAEEYNKLFPPYEVIHKNDNDDNLDRVSVACDLHHHYDYDNTCDKRAYPYTHASDLITYRNGAIGLKGVRVPLGFFNSYLFPPREVCYRVLVPCTNSRGTYLKIIGQIPLPKVQQVVEHTTNTDLLYCAVALSGNRIAYTNNKQVVIYEKDTQKILKQLPLEHVRNLAVLPNGNLVLLQAKPRTYPSIHILRTETFADLIATWIRDTTGQHSYGFTEFTNKKTYII